MKVKINNLNCMELLFTEVQLMVDIILLILEMCFMNLIGKIAFNKPIIRNKNVKKINRKYK
jgi:hypothetical protein